MKTVRMMFLQTADAHLKMFLDRYDGPSSGLVGTLPDYDRALYHAFKTDPQLDVHCV